MNDFFNKVEGLYKKTYEMFLDVISVILGVSWMVIICFLLYEAGLMFYKFFS